MKRRQVVLQERSPSFVERIMNAYLKAVVERGGVPGRENVVFARLLLEEAENELLRETEDLLRQRFERYLARAWEHIMGGEVSAPRFEPGRYWYDLVEAVKANLRNVKRWRRTVEGLSELEYEEFVETTAAHIIMTACRAFFKDLGRIT